MIGVGVRADFDVIERNGRAQDAMHLVERLPGHLPAGDGRLIGREHGEKSGVVHPAHRLGDSGDQCEVFERERAVRVGLQRGGLHQHTIAIEKNGPAFGGHCSWMRASSEQIAEAPRKRLVARIRIGAPFDRELPHGESELAGVDQSFGVEHESIDSGG